MASYQGGMRYEICVKDNAMLNLKRCLIVSDRILTLEENKKLTTFERTSMEEYMLRRQKKIQDNIDYKVSSTSER